MQNMQRGDKEIKMFTREELWILESKALKEADSVLNPSWKRALTRLADAACEIDAYLARSECRIIPEESKNVEKPI